MEIKYFEFQLLVRIGGCGGVTAVQRDSRQTYSQASECHVLGKKLRKKMTHSKCAINFSFN